MPTDWFNRAALAVAGILGAAGVAAGAAASHIGDQRILGSLALVALTEAPAVLALALFAAATTLMRAATVLVGLGAIIFSADLAAIHFLGASPLPLMAPIGGLALIAGWLVLVVAAVVGRRG